MKICHIADTLPGYHKLWGGGAQSTYRIVKLLIKNNVENVVLAPKPMRRVNEKKEGFQFYAIPTAQDFFGEKIGSLLKRPFDPIAYFSSYRILKKIRPDVVHVHSFGNLGFGVVLAAKNLGIPVVFSVYNYWCFCPSQTLMKSDNVVCTRFHGPQCVECLLEKKDLLQKIFINKRRGIFDFFLFNKVDKFIALSNFLSKLLQDYGIKKEKIAVVRLPFKKIKLKKTKIKKNSILYAGFLVPRKGLHVILEAMPKILKKIPNATLTITGQEDPHESEYKLKIKGLIEKSGLKKNILLSKWKPESQLAELISQSNLVVIPEQWQNMSPLLVIESMMFGKGIVTTNMGGIPELIHHKKTGLLIKPFSSDDCADKIIWALKHKKEMEKMGKRARERAIKLFDEEKISNELTDVYNSVIIDNRDD